jgi:uncharacterized protein YjiS (DUF1127 family)
MEYTADIQRAVARNGTAPWIWFKTGIRSVARFMELRRAERQLGSLPNYLLRDMGISRSQVGSAIRYGRSHPNGSQLRRGQ